MKLPLWLLLTGACIALNAHAICTQSPESGTPVPHIFNVPDMTVNIDADAPADTSKVVDYKDASMQGYEIKLDQCHTGDLFGKSAMNLPLQGASYIYPTNIPGIGIKILWNNGAAFSTGQFPTSGTMDFSDKGGDLGSWVYPTNSYYRVEVYKTAETLVLNPQGINIAMTPNNYAYNWYTADSLTNAAQILHIGTIQIVSTPSCTFENSKTVDFGTVTGNMLNAGAQVDRPLDFTITCRTDYGSYASTASLSSDTASTDSSYINVTDASGAKDALAIKVTDSKSNWMKLDGSTSETLSGLASNVPAQFHWTATLMAQPGAQKHPVEGNFTAHAEILIQVK
jgi:type 1 fimbria pilin